MKAIFAATVGFIGVASAAAAQPPVAVVEDVQGKVTGAEFMDYVAPGTVIKLGQSGVVVLGYIKSCLRETISGIGTVIVGTDESMVHLGDVKTSKVRCDASRTRLIDRDAGESAATVVRGMNEKESRTPRLTLFGLSPIFETSGRGKLVVERLDAKGERYEFEIGPASTVRGKFYDFARTGTTLNAGGIYAASSGARRVVFLVDRQAEPGSSAIIGRLVRLE
jgi:uncharacterized membrane protein YtjA (UPF0391 family)